MIAGQSLTTLAQSILEKAKTKKDYAMDTRNLAVLEDGQLQFRIKGESRIVKPTERCMNQIGNRVGIPRAYMQRMAQEAPGLLANNINHWFQAASDVRMLRTYQNGENIGRAFLSHRYRALDHEDMIQAVIPRMVAAGCEIRSAEVTERRLYVQAVTPKLQGEIKKGDVVQAGVVVSNSEVGAGSIRVEPLLFRLVCTNGMILPTAMRRHHVGRAGEGDWEEGEAAEVFSDETRRLDDKAFWAKVCDVVDHSLTEINFGKALDRMREVAKVDTGRPTEAVEVLAKRYGFSDDEQMSVLEHLCKGGDLSLWGLANAVTRTAADLGNYDRAVEFERLGGEVIELPKNVFARN